MTTGDQKVMSRKRLIYAPLRKATIIEDFVLNTSTSCEKYPLYDALEGDQ